MKMVRNEKKKAFCQPKKKIRKHCLKRKLEVVLFIQKDEEKGESKKGEREREGEGNLKKKDLLYETTTLPHHGESPPMPRQPPTANRQPPPPPPPPPTNRT